MQVETMHAVSWPLAHAEQPILACWCIPTCQSWLSTLCDLATNVASTLSDSQGFARAATSANECKAWQQELTLMRELQDSGTLSTSLFAAKYIVFTCNSMQKEHLAWHGANVHGLAHGCNFCSWQLDFEYLICCPACLNKPSPRAWQSPRNAVPWYVHSFQLQQQAKLFAHFSLAFAFRILECCSSACFC